jgi:anthranilate phosphoribosyltransferase
MIREALDKVIKGTDLTEEEMKKVMDGIMDGNYSDILVSSFLTALKIKGESVAEITGAAKIMRKKAAKVNIGEFYAIDTCGTGGDEANTFNISTGVAFISAAAGVHVVKHGNRAVSSKSGSADVLEELGVNLTLDENRVVKCVEEKNIGFFFAPYYHSAMKNVIHIRRELKMRTIFNILGPLTNPAGAKGQVLGVFDPELTETMANVLKELGTEHALVVHGNGLDEITVTGRTKVTELKNGELRTYYLEPEDFGIKKASSKEVEGGSAVENADILKGIFSGEIRDAKRDILVLNGAAALYVGKKVGSIRDGVAMANEILDSGKVMDKLNEYIKYTNELEAI